MRCRHSIFIGVIAGLSLLPLAGCSRFETRAQEQKPAPAPLQFIAAWGTKGDGPGQLDDPISIATDSNGNVFIVDQGSGFIHKFGPRGTPLLSFQDVALRHPQSITVDSGGAIYVSDPVRDAIFIYFPSGKRYRMLRLRAQPNPENVLSIAVGEDGLIQALDGNAGKVYTFTRRMRLLHTWLVPAEAPGLKNRRGRVEIGPDWNLYIADPSAGRILRFTREGHLISQMGNNADETGLKLSNQLALSSKYVFAMDADGLTLHVWTLDGTHKMDVDLAPQLGQAPRAPCALAVSPRGELLVLDEPEARVLRYRINF